MSDEKHEPDRETSKPLPRDAVRPATENDAIADLIFLPFRILGWLARAAFSVLPNWFRRMLTMLLIMLFFVFAVGSCDVRAGEIWPVNQPYSGLAGWEFFYTSDNPEQGSFSNMDLSLHHATGWSSDSYPPGGSCAIRFDRGMPFELSDEFAHKYFLTTYTDVQDYQLVRDELGDRIQFVYGDSELMGGADEQETRRFYATSSPSLFGIFSIDCFDIADLNALSHLIAERGLDLRSSERLESYMNSIGLHRTFETNVMVARQTSAHEVTVSQFQEFLRGSHYEWPGCAPNELDPTRESVLEIFVIHPDLPITCVNWTDVRAYLAWVSEVSGESVRLLTEYEWHVLNEQRHPWPFSEPNRFGQYDLAMNAAEWLQTCTAWTGEGEESVPSCSERAVVGLSNDGRDLGSLNINRRDPYVGFRVVRETGSSE